MATEVKGLKDFRKELKDLEGDLDKELTKVHKKIAAEEASRIQVNADSAGGVWAKASKGITGVGLGTSAAIRIGKPNQAPMAPVAFWGAKKRTGWFANPKYGDYPSQHPEWVGNNWDAASKTEGPYVINYTLAEDLDRIVESYGGMLDDLFAKAFPD